MSVMDRMIAHMQQRRIPTFPPLPSTHRPLYNRALFHYTQGQFAQSSSAILSIPSEYNNYASYVILRVRTLLAQGYYHQAIRVLRENVEVIDEREGELGGKGEELEAGDEMLRDTWRLWIRLLYWDEEGMSEGKRKEVEGEAVRAWKSWCQWTQMETYTEVHSLLYEIIHQLPTQTLTLPLREWKDNIDTLLAHHMDTQSFTSALAILQVRNKVLDPTDPTFTNIMLEYFPILSSSSSDTSSSSPDNPSQDIKLIEARTRLILYDIYIKSGEYALAIEKLHEIDECLRSDAALNNDDTSRGYDLRWLSRFYKLTTPNPSPSSSSSSKSTVETDEDKLAKLSAMAHEAVNRDIPEFQLKALNMLTILYLRNRNFENFLAPETELIVKGQKYGQPPSFWRKHLQLLFENFPAPEDPSAEEFLTNFTKIMDGVEWTRGSEEDGGGGVIGVGLGLVVWTGVAEMLVGIEEFWRSKARKMVERVKGENVEGRGRGVKGVELSGLSRGLRRLWEE